MVIIDLITSILTLFESENRQCKTPVLSGPDLVQNDANYFCLLNSFLQNASPPPPHFLLIVLKLRCNSFQLYMVFFM